MAVGFRLLPLSAFQGRATLAGVASLIASAGLLEAATAKLDGSGFLSVNALLQGSLIQDHCRFRTDTAAVDAIPTWAVAEDTQFVISDASTFRVRLAIKNLSANTASAAGQFALYASHNGGPYQLVTTSSTFLKAADASTSPDQTQVLIPRLTP